MARRLRHPPQTSHNMIDPMQGLRELKPTKEFFIGIDSDGSVFDTMETKHKECFTPMYVKHFHLQAVSKFAREAWDFVNLYSKSRGTNRFPALAKTLNLLRTRKEVVARGIKVMDTTALEEWVSREKKLTNTVLAEEVKRGNHALEPVLQWSIAVNDMIADMVHGVSPFPLFKESLLKMVQKADVVIVSQTPTDALVREWEEHQISPYVRAIAGQELGTKADHIRFAAGGKYPASRILMVGDAPGDFQAAQANGALFFPIIPGREDNSWKRFHDESLERFFRGTFGGAYAAELLREFEDGLPEKPNW